MNLPKQSANPQPAAGMRLRTLLGELDLSEREAAGILGVKGRVLRAWCTGERRVPRIVWLALAAIKIAKTLE
jgi:hypothetical protein